MKQQKKIVGVRKNLAGERDKSGKKKYDSREIDPPAALYENEFDRSLEMVTIKLIDTERQLRKAEQIIKSQESQLREKDKKAIGYQQELQRLKHLLPIKDQLLRTEGAQVQQLKMKIQEMKQLRQRRSSKLNVTKAKLDNLSDIECDSLSEINAVNEDTIRQTSQSIHRKAIYSRNHGSDLQIAKLKNQNQKLWNEKRMLSIQIELIKIENEHLANECKLACTRERKLHQQVTKMILEKGRTNQIETWDKQCSKLQLFVDRMAQTYNAIDMQQIKGKSRVQPLHPPTPHFSSAGCGFGKQKKQFVSTATEGMFPLHEQVSLGEGDIRVADSCPPSI